LKHHCANNKKTKMGKWLKNINYIPEIKPIMKNVPLDILNYAEQKAISFYKNKFKLLNTVYN